MTRQRQAVQFRLRRGSMGARRCSDARRWNCPLKTPLRRANDVGTQYRSGIYVANDAQAAAAEASKLSYQNALGTHGYGKITTEIAPAGPFYFAEDYHQQYLAKNPHGYCGIGGTGVTC